MKSEAGIFDQEDISLLETLDHVLYRGLVIAGDITISVAGVDLIYLGVNLVVGSVDAIEEALGRSLDRFPVEKPPRNRK